MQGLSVWAAYWCIIGGIFVSLVMPIVRQLAKLPPEERNTLSMFRDSLWEKARPYFFMAIFSLMAALVILAGLYGKKLQVDSKSGAFLLGYFCDSTIQKLKP